MKDLGITDDDYQRIRVGDLLIDQEYQRKVNKAMIRRIKDEYDRHLLDAIRVSYREGKYRVLDGQHRCIAIRDYLGSPDTRVWCQVFTDLEKYEDEAIVFTKQQSSRKLTAIEDYHARVEAKVGPVLLLQNIVELNGFHVSSATKSYNIGCVLALEKILDDFGADILNHVLILISKTWNGDRPFLTAAIIRAVSLIVYTYVDSFDDEVFIRALSTVPIGQLKREAMSGLTTRDYHLAIINFYNRKARKKLDVKLIKASKKAKGKEYY